MSPVNKESRLKWGYALQVNFWFTVLIVVSSIPLRFYFEAKFGGLPRIEVLMFSLERMPLLLVLLAFGFGKIRTSKWYRGWLDSIVYAVTVVICLWYVLVLSLPFINTHRFSFSPNKRVAECCDRRHGISFIRVCANDRTNGPDKTIQRRF